MTDLQSRYIHALRTQEKTAAEKTRSDSFPCPYSDHEESFHNLDLLQDHVTLKHASKLKGLDPTRVRAQIREDVKKVKAVADQSSEATAGGTTTPDFGNLSLDPVNNRTSPAASKKRYADSEIPTHRGKAVSANPDIYDPDYARDIYPSVSQGRSSSKSLFNPKQGHSQSLQQGTSQASHRPLPQRNHSSHSNNARTQSVSQSQRQPGVIEFPRFDPRYPNLLLQPDSRPISQEQLSNEVKSIYAGLTMVENKCIDVDQAQKTALDNAEPGSLPEFKSEHWQALIALHRTLLHEHHDFFLASQHPSASPALRRLASKYSMPARMWKHGIHQFLELLRRNLPASMDYMLAFIYLAYQMVALLYETVPAFEDTWIECLGDLGRYRMAIEDDDIRDRDTWANVARSWYSKAADKNPTTGRLYHHLAILARSNPLLQLCYYSKSLNCVTPFPSARESILTSLDPVLEMSKSTLVKALPYDTVFILSHAILYKKLTLGEFESAQNAFLGQLDGQIGRVTAKWKEQGTYIGVINLTSLFDYGSDHSALRDIISRTKQRGQNHSFTGSSSPAGDSGSQSPPPMTHIEVTTKLEELSRDFTFSQAYSLTISTLSTVLRRIGDKNVLPHVHILFAFLSSVASMPYVAPLIDPAPWTEIATFLTALMKSERSEHAFSGSIFPLDQNDNLPLPDDYWIRGQIWSESYFPEHWFEREHDEDDRNLELASTIKSRIERILRIGYKLSSFGRWITYDQQSHTFSTTIPRNLA
ncbi:hypothetical protein B0J11DRAFT_204662 [Dendryphion nanum]|uniref:DNA/RNA-binding domain-containing protein n=1 Tax=Dendryphion nanum TaxID=256645 RepID=A0A9P9D182_9PLEO|nr:hypothetical protein B0J11DRAFT_204662 [Dendryphion nanum]